MAELAKLPAKIKRDIIAEFFGGKSFSQLADVYEITVGELRDFLQHETEGRFQSEFPEPEKQDEQDLHKKIVRAWYMKPLNISAFLFAAIVGLQYGFSSFDPEILMSSLAFITKPLSKVLDACLAISALILCLDKFVPILTVFMNENVNTVSLKTTFLKASAESKLYFLAGMVGALCYLLGNIFA